MCEPTFEEWFDSFAGELARLTGEPVDFDAAFDRYWPTFENGIAAELAPAMSPGLAAPPRSMPTNDALCSRPRFLHSERFSEDR
ncbi:hypothetical protein NKI74_33890 [Mesorhizobium sp. M0494]|uniref:hypothetical protein n=1 Tax=Mesorhizobium sp. M0494 TaxID=2956951 RepID=UPI0033350DAE